MVTFFKVKIMKIDGRFWLSKDGENFLGKGRVELLKTIDRIGSIHSAAKEMKMSYKAAWERINSMDELADQPLLIRTTGGKSGGGTKLTPYAHELIATFEKLEVAHREFIDRFSKAGSDDKQLKHILNRTFLTTSARNQLFGRVEKISFDSVEAELHIRVSANLSLISSITTASAKSMNLDLDTGVYAIIKSSDISISRSKQDNINSIPSTISTINSSKNSTEIILNSEDNIVLVSFINHNDASSFNIGDKVFAIIKKNDVLVGM